MKFTDLANELKLLTSDLKRIASRAVPNKNFDAFVHLTKDEELAIRNDYKKGRPTRFKDRVDDVTPARRKRISSVKNIPTTKTTSANVADDTRKKGNITDTDSTKEKRNTTSQNLSKPQKKTQDAPVQGALPKIRKKTDKEIEKIQSEKTHVREGEKYEKFLHQSTDTNNTRTPAKTDAKPSYKKKNQAFHRFDIRNALTEKYKRDDVILRKAKRSRPSFQTNKQNVIIPRKKIIKLEKELTINEFSKIIGVKSLHIKNFLTKLEIEEHEDILLDKDTLELIAEEYNVSIEFKEQTLDIPPTTVKESVKRSPIVTIMGHVDHGKTSLLDYIRKSKITVSEAGGITQSIGAYHIMIEKEGITFIDTPGHEAFSSMRARGANATDIVILVVAADDGIKPQTIEAIEHAKAAKTPIIVAINKCDKTGAKPEKILQDLLQHELVAEEFGGDCTMMKISSITGQGIKELLEIILLHADTMELKAANTGRAQGIILETHIETGKGVLASLLVLEGEIQQGDNVLAGKSLGRIRSMADDTGKTIKVAHPSIPIQIMGLAELPTVGDKFVTHKDVKYLKKMAEQLLQKKTFQKSIEENFDKDDILANFLEQKKVLHYVIKSGSYGSLEALLAVIQQSATDEIDIKIVHSGVGPISSSDIDLAATTKAHILGFNVRVEGKANKELLAKNVLVKTYDIIYNLIDYVNEHVKGSIKKEIAELLYGKADVLQAFDISKIGKIAGCRVSEGKIIKNSQVRVVRDNTVIHQSTIKSLRRHKDDAKEVATGSECGIGLTSFKEFLSGDIIECYAISKADA